MSRLKSALMFGASCAVYAAIIAVATSFVILVFTREFEQVVLYLSYAMLLEGGLAFVTGGVVASFAPAVGRISESVLHSKPWDAKRLRDAERQGLYWIVTGVFLFLFGLLVSAF